MTVRGKAGRWARVERYRRERCGEERERLFCIIKYLLFSQLLTNCRTGKADEALSFWFLIWLLGDVTNLIEALLTRQLATQV